MPARSAISVLSRAPHVPSLAARTFQNAQVFQTGARLVSSRTSAGLTTNKARLYRNSPRLPFAESPSARAQARKKFLLAGPSASKSTHRQKPANVIGGTPPAQTKKKSSLPRRAHGHRFPFFPPAGTDGQKSVATKKSHVRAGHLRQRHRFSSLSFAPFARCASRKARIKPQAHHFFFSSPTSGEEGRRQSPRACRRRSVDAYPRFRLKGRPSSWTAPASTMSQKRKLSHRARIEAVIPPAPGPRRPQFGRTSAFPTPINALVSRIPCVLFLNTGRVSPRQIPRTTFNSRPKSKAALSVNIPFRTKARLKVDIIRSEGEDELPAPRKTPCANVMAAGPVRERNGLRQRESASKGQSSNGKWTFFGNRPGGEPRPLNSPLLASRAFRAAGCITNRQQHLAP